MPDFYTDSQGRRRPITPAKGGAGVVVAGALALGVFASGGVSTVGGVAGEVAGEVAGAGGGTSSSALRAQRSQGRKAARKGDADGAWRSMKVRQVRRTGRQQAECLAVSYGEVQQLFARTRCTSLERAVFALVDDAGSTAVVSVVWVVMADAGAARRLKTVMDKHGTGDIRPLGSAALEMADVEFTGLRYGSDRDGRAVTFAEAENAPGGRFDHDTLDALAEVAAYLPRV
ncbi:hypothetical protein [Saccharothrix obliqua]|uniref:hypothetical protein n=1 Tax=Saccharothrix obliqua TaxID=2861747 RepID=UPI001C6058F5|nr:hypothetical protein [Saccharothrix obliqua]MBW4718828.1 hypothetical protein [Saccharothrix obliqua]